VKRKLFSLATVYIRKRNLICGKKNNYKKERKYDRVVVLVVTSGAPPVHPRLYVVVADVGHVVTLPHHFHTC
jgi:hypothetical protein